MGCLSPWGACLILNNAFLVFLEMAIFKQHCIRMSHPKINLWVKFGPKWLKNDKVMAFLVFFGDGAGGQPFSGPIVKQHSVTMSHPKIYLWAKFGPNRLKNDKVMAFLVFCGDGAGGQPFGGPIIKQHCITMSHPKIYLWAKFGPNRLKNDLSLIHISEPTRPY